MNNIETLLNSRKLKLCVIGLGYVGLPIALSYLTEGYTVVGFDVNEKRVCGLKSIIELNREQALENTGVSYHRFKTSESDYITQKKFIPTNNPEDLIDCDAFFICVPTPMIITKEKYEPDMLAIEKTASMLNEVISKNVEKERVIILVSTVYPGATRDLLYDYISENHGNQIPKTHIVFAPEREDPGNKDFNTKNTPRLVGGMSEEGANLAKIILEKVCDKVIKVSSPEVAELAKLLENTYRYINIAFINEFASYCPLFDADAFEVIEAAATKPFGFQKFKPSAGIGGHCIPVVPHFTNWALQKKNELYDFCFVNTAKEVEDSIKVSNVGCVLYALERLKVESYKEAKVLIYGVSFKPNISDTRESPAIPLIKSLREFGVNITIQDEIAKQLEVKNIHGKTEVFKSVEDPDLSKYDVVVICTKHLYVSETHIIEKAKFVVDLSGCIESKYPNVYRKFREKLKEAL